MGISLGLKHEKYKTDECGRFLFDFFIIVVVLLITTHLTAKSWITMGGSTHEIN